MTNPYAAATKFAAEFGSMEYALKRSPKFRRPNRVVAEADWDAFANELGQEFFDHIVKSGIARTLIGKPPRRLLSNMKWEPQNPSPLSNVAQLIINGVCRVRNSYLHGDSLLAVLKDNGSATRYLLRKLMQYSRRREVSRLAKRNYENPISLTLR